MENSFKQAVREGRPWVIPNTGIVPKSFNWIDFIQLIDSCPTDIPKGAEQLKFYQHDKQSIELRRLEKRNSAPQFCKQVIAELKKVFTKNQITCIAFSCFTKEGKSFSIHKDKMDVYYLQVLGTVRFELWEQTNDSLGPVLSASGLTNAEIDANFRRFFYRDMMPGDFIWVPRGTFHKVIPYESRVGMSFGVEGNPNPKDYI